MSADAPGGARLYYAPVSWSIENDGESIKLWVDGRWIISGSPGAMRAIRDKLTRAIICAEVMAGMAPIDVADKAPDGKADKAPDGKADRAAAQPADED